MLDKEAHANKQHACINAHTEGLNMGLEFDLLFRYGCNKWNREFSTEVNYITHTNRGGKHTFTHTYSIYCMFCSINIELQESMTAVAVISVDNG